MNVHISINTNEVRDMGISDLSNDYKGVISMNNIYSHLYPQIFLDNKYTRWYMSIINNAIFENRYKTKSSYYELHHIIPDFMFLFRSRKGHKGFLLGFSGDKANLVLLSAREHFVCHWLLTKMMFPGKTVYQSWNAFSCMLYRKNDNQNRDVKLNSRKYENIKKLLNINKSINNKGKKHKKRWSAEAKLAHSLRLKGRQAWNLGKKGYTTKAKGVPNTKNQGKNNGMNNGGVIAHRQTFMMKYGVYSPTQVPFKCEYCGKEGKGMGVYVLWHGKNCKQSPTYVYKERKKSEDDITHNTSCLFCRKTCSYSNFIRWHGDKCKNKVINI
jgi:hypothetical protein